MGWRGGQSRAGVWVRTQGLARLSGFANAVSRDALALYMQFSNVPAPYSIYEDVFKLTPGCLLAFDAKIF